MIVDEWRDGLFKDEITGMTMFNCPRCRTPHQFYNPALTSIWQCCTCDITLHYQDRSFLEILIEAQKKYAPKGST